MFLYSLNTLLYTISHFHIPCGIFLNAFLDDARRPIISSFLPKTECFTKFYFWFYCLFSFDSIKITEMTTFILYFLSIFIITITCRDLFTKTKCSFFGNSISDRVTGFSIQKIQMVAINIWKYWIYSPSRSYIWHPIHCWLNFKFRPVPSPAKIWIHLWNVRYNKPNTDHWSHFKFASHFFLGRFCYHFEKFTKNLRRKF